MKKKRKKKKEKKKDRCLISIPKAYAQPQLDADCLWRSPFVQNNSVSGNTGPGTVYGPSDEMYVSEEMIQQRA